MGDPPVVHATGGAGGIVANQDAILGLASAYDDAHKHLFELNFMLMVAHQQLGAAETFDSIGLTPMMGAAAPARAEAGRALTDTAKLLEHAGQLTGRLRFHLIMAAAGYRWGVGLDALVGPSLWDEAIGFVGGVAGFAWGMTDPQRYLVQHPGVVDDAVNHGETVLLLTPYGGAVVAVDAYRDLVEGLDGSGHAEPRGVATSTAAPRSLADLSRNLANRDDGPGGSIDVQIITGADGSRHVVVDITGIDTAVPVPPGRDVADLTTCARAIDGKPTAYEQGVFDAMRRAGVRPGDPVLIVGHSLGGMIAVNAARTAARTGRYNVTHVVTEGSPIGKTVGRMPSRVQVLAIENTHDIVPHLDGRSNPDRTNVTTVSGAAGDGSTVSGDHDSRTVYVPLAGATDKSTDVSVQAFLRSADGFLSGSSMTTHAYQVVRS